MTNHLQTSATRTMEEYHLRHHHYPALNIPFLFSTYDEFGFGVGYVLNA